MSISAAQIRTDDNRTAIPGNWREILEHARREFTNYDGCIGLAFGEKRTNDRFTGKPAIVVYVAEKRDPENVPRDQLIAPDAEFEGCATDVVAPFGARQRRYLDYVIDHQRSHDLASIDHLRVNQAHRNRVETLPDPGRVGAAGQVLIMEDPDGRFVTTENGEAILDLVSAYRAFHENSDDVFDFVTFFSDVESGMPSFDTSFHWGVHNEIEGIGLPIFDRREALGGSTALQSIHFIHHTQLNRYVMLQELAHRWCAFVGFREQPTGPNRYDLLIPSGAGALSHWGIQFDDDRSPVDYDSIDWIEERPGVFRYAPLADPDRAFCNLDLYLMGLMPASEVGPFHYLDHLQPLGGRRYAAAKHRLTVSNVIWAEGERTPSAASSQRKFRQAFVLLTRSFDAALSYAATIDRFRTQFEADFADATGSRASVDTRLRSEPVAGVQGGYIEQVYDRRVPIADPAPGAPSGAVQSSLSFVEDAVIQHVVLSVDIRHDRPDDLVVTLVGPDGTQVTVQDRSGPSVGQMDETYTPENLPELARFAGRSARGEWTLRIAGARPVDEGYLEAWALRLQF